jgi:D-glucosaminate-6-phosphate ammonia-lyase
MRHYTAGQTAAHARAAVKKMSVYEQLGATAVINAVGPVTRLGGSPVAPDITAVMAEAAQHCVDIGQLQGHASNIIAAVTGAEAGIVTSGASAGLLLATAACLAGMDPVKMSQLPDTAGLRHEVIVARIQRNSYDHAVRAAGAKLVEAGCSDRAGGIGSCDTEQWELRSAVTAQTAAFLYVAKPHWQPSLATIVAVARESNLPVIVDAAAELPPASNLRAFIAAGADLVVFSGGKAIGGPSASGVLCGRRRLIGSALLQQLDLDYTFDQWDPPATIIDKQALPGVPRHGIGRSCKVGKEQIVGLIAALRTFAGESDRDRCKRLEQIARLVLGTLEGIADTTATMVSDPQSGMPSVELRVANKSLQLSASELATRLQHGSPSILVDRARANDGVLIIALSCLRPGEPDFIGQRLRQIVASQA